MRFWKRVFGVECNHDFEELGKYYRLDITNYRSRTDSIRIYIRLMCKKCKKIEDKLLMEKEYRSLVFDNVKNDGRQEYMDELECRGVCNKEQIEEKTVRLQLGIRQ